MELLGIVALLVGLAATALRWGEESRPEFGPDRVRST
jgi:hypothetical protein